MREGEQKYPGGFKGRDIIPESAGETILKTDILLGIILVRNRHGSHDIIGNRK